MSDRPAPGLRQRLVVGPRQKQRLTLTPQVRQTIEMLALPLVELQSRVDAELLENPALEDVTDGPDAEDGAEPDEEDQEPSEEEEAEEAAAGDGAEKEEGKAGPDAPAEADRDSMSEIETESFFAENHENSGSPSGFGDEPPGLDRTLAAARTLSAVLTEQLGPAVRNENERRIGLAIIGNLDERGYLDAELAELASMLRVTEEAVEEARRKIMRFDPTGCACLDIRECLLVQLEASDEDAGPLPRIVRDHLDLVMEERFSELSEKIGLPFPETMEWVTRLGRLSFHPGESYSQAPDPAVVPDARVYRFNGAWRVEMNETLPRLRVSPAYREAMRASSGCSPREREYAREAYVRANGFRRSVQQRQETVRLVAEDLVRKQEAFLNGGIEFIRPLVLNDVAADIGRAESTVSRVVSNKYLQTPQGIIPFRRFFHSALALRDGRQVSSEAVKMLVKRAIDREDPEFPLSDDQVVRLMERRGIIIARRTVAKYRKTLRIASSSDRRTRYRNRPPGRSA